MVKQLFQQYANRLSNATSLGQCIQIGTEAAFDRSLTRNDKRSLYQQADIKRKSIREAYIRINKSKEWLASFTEYREVTNKYKSPLIYVSDGSKKDSAVLYSAGRSKQKSLF